MPYDNLGFIFTTLGNWEGGLEEAREAIRLEPNCISTSAKPIGLNRLDEAEAVFKQAKERKLEIGGLSQARYVLAFLKGDTAQMARLAAAAMGKPGTEDLMLAEQAETEGWYGKLKNARELTRRAMDSAQRNDAKETAAAYQVTGGGAKWNWATQTRPCRRRCGTEAGPESRRAGLRCAGLAQPATQQGRRSLAAELDGTFPLSAVLQRMGYLIIRAASP